MQGGVLVVTRLRKRSARGFYGIELYRSILLVNVPTELRKFRLSQLTRLELTCVCQTGITTKRSYCMR